MNFDLAAAAAAAAAAATVQRPDILAASYAGSK